LNLRYYERELPGPALGDLRLDLDRHTGRFDIGAGEHLSHPVDHGLLEPSDDLLGLILAAPDQDLVEGIRGVPVSHQSFNVNTNATKGARVRGV
jgi:hypothetical protein